MHWLLSMTLTPYQAKYFAYELTKRSSSDSLQKLASTLLDAQVDLNPHQVEAALFAFCSPLSKGAILADEVGLGKTIEAGIVVSQKWAERKRKILIITPANLRKQWSQELMDKFFLTSSIMETQSFNNEVKGGNFNPFNSNDIIICSYQFARTKEAYLKLVPWDLVVIDEAHRLRNVYKSSNKIGKSIKNSLEHAPKVLLTATPLQNSLLELYGLVSIIDDYTFGDLKSFKAQYAKANSLPNEQGCKDLKQRLKPICKRTLRRQVVEYINYTNRIALVEEFYPTQEEQRLYDLVSDYLQAERLYALPASQRQLMTLILRRLLASSTYAISGTLEALAEKLEDVFISQTPDKIEEAVSTDFETYEEMKDEWAENEEVLEEKPKYTELDIENIKTEVKSLKEFSLLAKSISKNSKGEKLFTALEKGFEEAEKKGASKKALIFTESTRTQEYLRKNLESRGYAGQVVLFNGSNNDNKSREIYKAWLEQHQGTDRITGSRTADMRAALVDCFRDSATIMIATEAAAEGINLQFCSLVVNYDLPWNPQRIEQRIGRCHRYGQKHDVVVVNFLNKANAADQKVYQLLNEKFKLFNGVFGASDEVLGSIESGVDFEKRIARIYQDCRKPEEIEAAFNKLQDELENQISAEINQTRQKLLENFDEEVHEKLKINLLESKQHLSRYETLLWSITRFYLKDDADFALDEHSFTLKRNPFSEENIHPGPYRIGKNIDHANVYRISHPLAQRIINVCKESVLPEDELVFDYTGSQKKISILEPLIGKTGYLSLACITIESLEIEDCLIFSGILESGTVLDEEQVRRLFSLSSRCDSFNESIPFRDKLQELFDVQKTNIISQIADRNSRFFDEELEKLEKWSDDVKSGLEFELRELDREIKLLKSESKKMQTLEDKLKAQKEVKDLEKKRSMKRRSLFEAQDDVDTRKEGLLQNIEARLKQKVHTIELFTIRWRLI